ncbi:MAG: hypothetical protein KGI98_12110 [Euryarchaeota archaeon]|nr:hypothetical protein [Euryarchaeota archaeon]MDE1881214.1 hypothetical protein [Euryarchaeota archaeon]
MKRRMRGAVHPTVFVLLAVAFGVVLGVQAFTAEGAPSAPTMQLQSALTPSTAQTAQIVITSQVYSVQPPNSIDLLGAKVVYTAWQNGVQVSLTQSQALGVTGGSGSLYTLTGTLPVALSQVCSGSACGGYAENVTVTAQVVVSTYDGVYSSAPVTVTFLSNGQGSLMPAFGPTSQPGPSSGQFNFNLYGALAAATALELTLAAAWFKNWIGAVPAVIAWLVTVIMFLSWA